ncbi:MAG: hypothetical protein ABFD66_13640, partial [Smithella sp.]
TDVWQGKFRSAPSACPRAGGLNRVGQSTSIGAEAITKSAGEPFLGYQNHLRPPSNQTLRKVHGQSTEKSETQRIGNTFHQRSIKKYGRAIFGPASKFR